MTKFLASLLSGGEAEVDAVNVGVMVALVVLCGVTIYVVIQDHTSWNPTTFSLSVAGLLGACAGGKRLRDGTPSQDKQP
jgi:hypothetical protein